MVGVWHFTDTDTYSDTDTDTGVRGCIRIRILFFKKIFVGSVLTDTRKISVFVFEYGIGDSQNLTDIVVIFFILVFVFKTDLRWVGGFVFVTVTGQFKSEHNT